MKGYFLEACKELGVATDNIRFTYEGIGQHFATSENAAESNSNDEVIINTDWIDATLESGDYYDFRFLMYHEARHFYQNMIIQDFLKRGKSKELPATIKQWIYEAKNYIRNEGTPESAKANRDQLMEIDANAFALCLLQKNGITEMRIPPGQEDVMIKRMKEIVLGVWRLKADIH